MVNNNVKMAFGRIDYKLQPFLNHPSCPGMARTIYEKAKGLMASMSAMPEPAQAQGQGE
jgi:hypothetical protein